MIDEVVLFLEGKQDSLLSRLQHEMTEAAEHLNFEAAARLRDRIVHVRRVTEGQKVVWRSRLDMDLIASARAQGQACMQVFMVRGGKLIGQEHFILDGVHDQPEEELIAEFLEQFYTARTASAYDQPAASALTRVARDQEPAVPEKARARTRAASVAASAIPKEVLVQTLPGEDHGVIESWLSEVKEQRVRILQPQRGERAEYLRLVQKNAEQNLKSFLVHQEVAGERASARPYRTRRCARASRAAASHRVLRHLEHPRDESRRSMVVFVEGRAKKSDYRKFKIQYDKGPNDFAMMQETLRRRLRYLRHETDDTLNKTEKELAKKEKFNKKPDLLLIDGGKGQLSAVVEVIEEIDMTGIPVAGLAKEHEWLYVPGNPDPIVLAPNSPGLHLVMRIRDEAHRFAVTYHRQRRAKAMTQSALDALAGVGPVRRKRLLAAFGSVAAIKRASVDEIAAVKGMTAALAAQIKTALEGGS